MKFTLCVFFIFSTLLLNTYCQTISVNSISVSRQPIGDTGYSLDGIGMTSGSRMKLLNLNNFGPGGIYPKAISIFDGYKTTRSLTSVYSIPTNNIFFFGAFNKLDASTQQFSIDEIDSLYNWSKRGGKVIIALGGTYGTSYDANILNNKWDFSYHSQNPSNIIPNANGNNTDLFNGPFGNVLAANQGASAQGYFNTSTSNSKVLATDINGNATVIMDCNTLDLIVADIDAYTDLGGISFGPIINNAQDRFLANTFVFMDKLQSIPELTNDKNTFLLNTAYNEYQWYLNDGPIHNARDKHYTVTRNGNYCVEVTLNGGCKVKSNVLIYQAPEMPDVFTPNNDNINDFFIPKKMDGITIRQISIFDRWGNIIHNEEKPQVLWNGKVKGGNAPEGVYYWVMEFNNSMATDVIFGYVQLIR